MLSDLLQNLVVHRMYSNEHFVDLKVIYRAHYTNHSLVGYER